MPPLVPPNNAEPPDNSPGAPESSITYADPSEPFYLKPLITDLLRTRYCIPDSILLVEDLQVVARSPTSKWRLIRLILGDGELCIQALLRPEMHRFVDVGTVQIGCYVRLGAFTIEQQDVAAPDESGPPSKMVYLIVDDLVTVGWHPKAARVSPAAPQQDETTVPGEDKDQDQDEDEDDEEEEEGEEEDEEDQEEEDEVEEEDDVIPSSDVDVDDMEEAMAEMQARRSPETPTRRRTAPRPERKMGQDKDEEEEEEEDFDDDDIDFEDMVVSPSMLARRREQLAAQVQHPPVALPRDWTDPSIPLKLTPLKSIPHLPYKQNWSMNALVVVTSLDPVEPCTVPPYSMRQARLADPSTTKQILLTVFLDPDEFSPKIGSVVLLVAVKNHLYDGGSLKKYVSDKPQRPGERWWYEEPHDFAWCDVNGMKAWWETGGKTSLDDLE